MDLIVSLPLAVPQLRHQNLSDNFSFEVILSAMQAVGSGGRSRAGTLAEESHCPAARPGGAHSRSQAKASLSVISIWFELMKQELTHS